MNRINSVLFLALLSSAFIFSSCERKEPTPITPVEIGGKGGNASIIVVSKHHSKFIDSCTVYIKYNALDKPATDFSPSQYDETVKCVKINSTESAATFTGLKKGNYYLFGVGWDNDIDTTVVGGKPFTISSETTHNTVLYVTEGD